MTQHGQPPTAPPSQAPAIITAVALLCVLCPILAVTSFYAVGYGMDWLLDPEDACVTYACGVGTGFSMVLVCAIAMVVMWVAGLIAATLAARRTGSVPRAAVAATITALVVMVISMIVNWSWIVLSV